MLAKIWHQFIRTGFYLLYNPLAWSYDLVSWTVSLGRWRAWQRASLSFVTGPRVLELAHGPGHMLPLLAESGKQVVGCDLSPTMGRLARARLHRRPLTAEIPLIRCRIPNLPFADQSFDTVLSQFPTNFITQRDTLRHVYRLLAPHGRFVILPTARLTGDGPLRRFIRWLFAVTGQGSAVARLPADVWAPFLQEMTAIGFAARVEIVTLDDSEVTVIVAQK